MSNTHFVSRNPGKLFRVCPGVSWALSAEYSVMQAWHLGGSQSTGLDVLICDPRKTGQRALVCWGDVYEVPSCTSS